MIIKTLLVLINNPIQHDRTKHVEIDRHFIKERLGSGSICILYIPSSQQVVDVLTKGLLRPNFDFCVRMLGIIHIYVPTWEGVLELVGLGLRVFMERFTLIPKFYFYSIVYSFYSPSDCICCIILLGYFLTRSRSKFIIINYKKIQDKTQYKALGTSLLSTLIQALDHSIDYPPSIYNKK